MGEIFMRVLLSELATGSGYYHDVTTVNDLRLYVHNRFGAPDEFLRLEGKNKRLHQYENETRLTDLGFVENDEVVCSYDLRGGDALDLTSFLTLLGGLLLIGVAVGVWICLGLTALLLYYVVNCCMFVTGNRHKPGAVKDKPEPEKNQA